MPRLLVALLLSLSVEETLQFQLVRPLTVCGLRRSASPLCVEEDDGSAGAAEAEAAEAAEAAADPKTEKKALRAAIAELEAKLPAARGALIDAENVLKDAGENGYMLTAANFERFREQARSELKTQSGFGKVDTLRSLLPFIESYEVLQQADVDADGGAIHQYCGLNPKWPLKRACQLSHPPSHLALRTSLTSPSLTIIQ